MWIYLTAAFVFFLLSSLFSIVRLLCQTTHDCSSMLWMKRMCMLSILVVKLATFHSNSIWAFLCFTRFSVFKSHFRSSEIVTPSNLECFTIYRFSLFRFSRIWNHQWSHPVMVNLLCHVVKNSRQNRLGCVPFIFFHFLSSTIHSSCQKTVHALNIVCIPRWIYCSVLHDKVS